MADVKISELPAVTTIDAATDVLPLVSLDGGATLTTYKSTAQQTMNAALAAPGPIGSGTANTGAFTTLSASSTVSGTGFSTYLASPPAIGGTAPAAGSFTNVSSSGTVSGAGFSNYLASPPAIGGTAAAAGSFTTLSASSTVSGTGFSDYLASPPAIGGTAAAAGSFTTIVANSVGVGTATPQAKIECVSTTSGLGGWFMCGQFTAANYPMIRLAATTPDKYSSIGNNADGSLQFFVNGSSGVVGSTAVIIDASSNLLVGTITSPSGSQTSGNIVANGVISSAGYTVATLPTGMPTGSRAYVSDALTPVVLTAVSGGGAVVVPVFYDGTNWIVG